MIPATEPFWKVLSHWVSCDIDRYARYIDRLMDGWIEWSTQAEIRIPP
jgi:hypothetical protein